MPGKVNYFLGNDLRQWHTNVSTFAKVDYQSVYPGINLDYYGRQGQLEYDFVVAPGADPRTIQMGFSGAQQVNINGQGDLVLHAGNQNIVQHKPVAYQEVNGHRQEVASAFVLLDHSNPLVFTSHQIGFALGSFDRSQPLVIDPVLSYSSYLGGSGNGYPYFSGDSGNAITVDGDGNAYLTGSTSSFDFPTTPGAFQTRLHNFTNAFVTKLNPSGTALIYSTYLGGSGSNQLDQGTGIAVDGDGNAYVTGEAQSTDFPTANAFQPTKGGSTYNYNAFVTKVSADGASLVYSSYLGGSGNGSPNYNGDSGNGIAVDADGSAYLTGSTYSTDFPTANAFQPTKGGAASTVNAFVTKVSADGTSLVYSSYLGGSGYYDGRLYFGDSGQSIAVGGSGNVYLTGYTSSTDFPTANAFQPTKGGRSGIPNAFVTEVSADGSGLVYSTYLGGSESDTGRGIAVDAADDAYVTGSTYSLDFPTANAFQPTKGGGMYTPNAFVAKVSADGSGLVYSSYLGGSDSDHGSGIAVDGSGNVYLTGDTSSTDFPTVDAFQPTKGGYSSTPNAFVTKVSADGSGLVYSSYLGGSGYFNSSANVYYGDGGSGIAVDVAGSAYLTGATVSSDFPTTPGAFQTTYPGTMYAYYDDDCQCFVMGDTSNGFVTKIED